MFHGLGDQPLQENLYEREKETFRRHFSSLIPEADERRFEEIFEQLKKNIDSEVNSSPLLAHASSLDKTKAMEFFLDHGADPNLEDREGYSAVDFAVCHGKEETLDLLIQRGGVLNFRYDDDYPLMNMPIHRNRVDVIKLLVKKGCDLNRGRNIERSPIRVDAEILEV